MVDAEAFAGFERSVMLQSLDSHWREHLSALDHLRQGIHLRGYAQKNPKQEYKREAFELFTQMLESLKQQVVSIVCRVQVQEPDVDTIEEQRRQSEATQVRTYSHEETNALAEDTAVSEHGQAVEPFVRDGNKVGRNDPCPCGSGKKYKHCHGKLD
jgi:preprotein translocase subunit SecA